MKFKVKNIRQDGRFWDAESMYGQHAAAKTWKHFFDPREHWERLCNCDTKKLSEKAEVILGSRQTFLEMPVLTDSAKNRQAQQELEHAHESYYYPLYRDACQIPVHLRKAKNTLYVEGKAGIVVILGRYQKRDGYLVKTAFRVTHGLKKKIDYTEDDFIINARQYVDKQAAKNSHDMAAAILYRADTLTMPGDLKEAWFLARAAGWLNILGDDGGLNIGIQVMRTWEQADASLKAELWKALDFELLLDEAAAQVKAEDDFELLRLLAEAEDLTAVGLALGGHAAVDTFCDSLVDLLAWHTPMEWLLEMVRQRLSIFENSSPLQRLWEGVANVFGDALLDLAAQPDGYLENEEGPDPAMSDEDAQDKVDILKWIATGAIGAMAVGIIKRLLNGASVSLDEMKKLLARGNARNTLPSGMRMGPMITPKHAAVITINSEKTQQYTREMVLDSADNMRVFKHHDDKLFEVTSRARKSGKITLSSGDVVIVFQGPNVMKYKDFAHCIQASVSGECKAFYESV